MTGHKDWELGFQLWDDKVRKGGNCWKSFHSIAIIMGLIPTFKFRDSAASVDFGGGGELQMFNPLTAFILSIPGSLKWVKKTTMEKPKMCGNLGRCGEVRLGCWREGTTKWWFSNFRNSWPWQFCILEGRVWDRVTKDEVSLSEY